MPIRVGFVGAGSWVLDALGPAVANHPEYEVGGVWARDPERGRCAAKSIGGNAFHDLEPMLEGMDAVVLGVPPRFQPDFAVAAAQRGCAVWLEKPFAEANADLVSHVAQLRAASVPVFFHLPYREAEQVLHLAEWAKRKDLQHLQVRFISGSKLRDQANGGGWRSTPRQGVMLDLGPHAIGLAEQVAGPIRTVEVHWLEDGFELVATHDVATSTITVMSAVAIDPSITSVEAFAGNEAGFGNGYCFADARAESLETRLGRSLDRFASFVIEGTPNESCGLDEAVHLQQVLNRLLIDEEHENI